MGDFSESFFIKKYNYIATILKSHNFILTDYQKVGIRWMFDRETLHNSGGILADDPGLGKTLQLISLMYVSKKSPTLIIVPKSILNQWISNISLIFERKKIYVHYGDEKKHDSDFLEEDFDICITTYYNILGKNSDIDSNILCNQNIEWKRIIIDEGHILRNKKTQIYTGFKNLCSENTAVWIVTGTPIQNKDSDMINLLNLITDEVTPQNFSNLVDNFVLRRSKQILIENNELEEYTIENCIIPFQSDSEQKIYELISQNLVEDLLKNKKKANSSNFDLNILDLLSKMRQAVIHPSIALESIQKKEKKPVFFEIEYSKNTISTKINALVCKISSHNENSLVFCHFYQEMELISNFLKLKGIDSSIFKGDLSLHERAQILNQYTTTSAKNRVLIIQIKAGGVGLNLQQFSKVYLMSPDWNPANEIQAIARSHRKGQIKKVQITKFTVCYNKLFNDDYDKKLTIDEIILDKQKQKREIMVEILKDDSLSFKERCIE